MRYGRTRLFTDWSREDRDGLGWRLIRKILFFIPEANPDTERLYPKVREWLLEIDEEGVPQREIGIDANGEPVFGCPDDRNFGFWVDSPNIFEADELDVIEKEDFEDLWLKSPNIAEQACMEGRG